MSTKFAVLVSNLITLNTYASVIEFYSYLMRRHRKLLLITIWIY